MVRYKGAKKAWQAIEEFPHAVELQVPSHGFGG
jgi:hypothetical protein